MEPLVVNEGLLYVSHDTGYNIMYIMLAACWTETGCGNIFSIKVIRPFAVYIVPRAYTAESSCDIYIILT